MGGEVLTIFRPACSLKERTSVGGDREERPRLAGTFWRLVAHAAYDPIFQDQVFRLGVHLQAEVGIALRLSCLVQKSHWGIRVYG